MTTDRIPTAREALEDRLRTHIEHLNDERVSEHHDLRVMHRAGPDGVCVEDGKPAPCPTMRRVDRDAVTGP